MKAIIIGQNHTVTTYQVNGKKRYIIEDIPSTNNREIVNMAVSAVGRKWADVYNYLDKNGALPDSSIEKLIDQMTY